MITEAEASPHWSSLLHSPQHCSTTRPASRTARSPGRPARHGDAVRPTDNGCHGGPARGRTPRRLLRRRSRHRGSGTARCTSRGTGDLRARPRSCAPRPGRQRAPRRGRPHQMSKHTFVRRGSNWPVEQRRNPGRAERRSINRRSEGSRIRLPFIVRTMCLGSPSTHPERALPK